MVRSRKLRLRLLAARALICVAGLLTGVQLFAVKQWYFGSESPTAATTSTSIQKPEATQDTSMVRNENYEQKPLGDPVAQVKPDVDPSEQRRRLLFVGVMTADVFLESRAVAVHDTWASTLASDADGAHAFFTSQKSSGPEHLPIVRLQGVTDDYPPQMKSFMMLKYMYENYGKQYEWFMRADDDVYVRTERLARLLRGVNSSQPKFIGQAGRGDKFKMGLLSLQDEENYCMGGPGIVISHATLERIYPHIRYCLANMYTPHEDVEIGRCVKRFTGVSCLWNYEMIHIFHHEYEGTNAFLGSLKKRKFTNAITLHPFKSSPLLYRIHHFFLSEQIKELQLLKVKRNRDILRYTDPEDITSLPALTIRLGLEPTLKKLVINEAAEVLPWMHINKRFKLNAANVDDVGFKGDSWLQGVRDITTAIMDNMSNSKKLRQSIKSVKFNYGYYRIDPIYGIDMVLDLGLEHTSYQRKPSTEIVRQHIYMQQAIGEPEVRVTSHSEWTVVNIVVGVAGKMMELLRFCDNLEKIGLDNLRIVFVYHENVDKEQNAKSRQKLRYMQDTYGEAVQVINVTHSFERSMSNMLGASMMSDDDLILFNDIDILFTSSALDNVRNFVVQGKQVYFPIVFSEYDPHSDLMDPTLVETDHFTLDDRRGVFRYYGYGTVGLYKSDLKAVRGFDETIHGWGKEDVNFMERVLRHPSNYTVIRAAEPGMVHAFHDIHCAETLANNQKSMCYGTQRTMMSHKRTLAWHVIKNEDLLQFSSHLEKKPPVRAG